MSRWRTIKLGAVEVDAIDLRAAVAKEHRLLQVAFSAPATACAPDRTNGERNIRRLRDRLTQVLEATR